MKSRIVSALIFTFTTLLGAHVDANAVDQEPFSLVLEGGSVWKGLGSKAMVVDVGIRGDRIALIGDLSGITAERRINVTGLAVVPGFIDLHSHAVRDTRENSGIFTHPDAENYIRQGVTTVIAGPDGGSELSVSDLLSDFEKTPASINMGSFIGHNTVRAAVMGRDNRAPTEIELEAMKTLVRTAMEEGAFGLSSGLKYIPGAYSSTEEVIELASVVAGFDGIYISHVREEGPDVVNSVKEAIRIGEEGGLPAQITHHKAMGVSAWGASRKTLALVDAANARGVDVSSDQYPYTASSTGISVLFPAWSLAGDTDAQLARLKDPEQRAQIKQGIIQNLVNDRAGDDPSRVAIAHCEWDPSLDGKNFAEILSDRGLVVSIENAAELALGIQEKGGCSGIFHAMSEEDVDRIMQHPRTMIASDGGIYVPGEGVPHPRSYGGFARVLSRYVRERGVISAGEAIYKMSRFPAERIGLHDRGRIETGAFADIAVLDLDAVEDQATFEQPHRYARGAHYVLVNGTLVLDDGKMTGQRPGRALRSRK